MTRPIESAAKIGDRIADKRGNRQPDVDTASLFRFSWCSRPSTRLYCVRDLYPGSRGGFGSGPGLTVSESDLPIPAFDGQLAPARVRQNLASPIDGGALLGCDGGRAFGLGCNSLPLSVRWLLNEPPSRFHRS